MKKVLLGALLMISVLGCSNEKEAYMLKTTTSTLTTRWAQEVNPDNALPEYPRPALKRSDWKNLNGLWDYTVTNLESGQPQAFDGKILVPFPIESALSGVGRTVSGQERIWYRRTFDVPENWQDRRILLHFEAVDWEAEIRINGEKAGNHRGGYDPFSIDITDYLKTGMTQELVVAVWDPTDKGPQPRGKQVSEPGGIWYTAVSGIWQTVWLEPVPESHIQSIKMITDMDSDNVHITADVTALKDGDQLMVAFSEPGGSTAGTVAGSAGESLILQVANPRLWSPDDPHLYDLNIRLVRDGNTIDVIDSYFGMRKVSIGKDGTGRNRILFNNEFLFQVGTLDQGFWPDGIYTAPTDEALKYDIQMTKELGFNLLRKHVKIENRRFYYWCDLLGILVWQDMPSGDAYIGPDDPDIVRTPESAHIYKTELTEMITTLFNHPSIIMWVPFNEGWGQFDTPGIVDLIKTLDPTRLVNNTSGWSDRGVGDVHDVHNYPDPRAPEPEKNRAIVVGEFGGLGLYLEGHTWQKENWGYQQMRGSDDYLDRYEDLFIKVWKLKENPGISAVVYTQITDVETETNGLMTYDRAAFKAPVEELRKINRGEFIPAPDVSPKGGLFFESRDVSIDGHGNTVRYTLDGTDPDAQSTVYRDIIRITGNTTLKAAVFDTPGMSSRVVQEVFTKTDKPEPVYKYPYSSRYTGGGAYALLDGKEGGMRYGDGYWQGFEGDDLDVTIDLSAVKTATSVSAGFLQDTWAWIFYPEMVTIEVSEDGRTFEEVHRETIETAGQDTPASVKRIVGSFISRPVRAVRIVARTIQTCPQWHDGAGGKAWIFSDEITIH